MQKEWTMLRKPRNTAELSQSRTSELGTSCNASRNSTPADEEVERQFDYPTGNDSPQLNFVPVAAMYI